MDDSLLEALKTLLIARNVQVISAVGESIGLHLNTVKCEIIHSIDSTLRFEQLNRFIHVSPRIGSVLGVPVFVGDASNSALSTCSDDLSRAIDRMKAISSHDTLILLRSS
jgi:hypothetical protein